MAKLVFSVLMVVLWWMLHTLQLDEELAMRTVSDAKHAVNRAVHAASQQVDQDKLELGIIAIDSGRAYQMFVAYLRENLALDGDLNPVEGSFLRDAVEVRVFQVINDDTTFPYTYESLDYQYEVTMNRPGVIVIIHLNYPRGFRVLAPVQWDLKGAAELVF